MIIIFTSIEIRVLYLIIITLSVIWIKLLFGLKCYHGITTKYFHSPISFQIKTCQAGNFCTKYHRIDFRYRRSFTVKSCDNDGICTDEGCTVGSIGAKFMGFMTGPLFYFSISIIGGNFS
ncbi:hypothetical protein LOAG_13897 [Loa loa]|uniref:Uncharacterized protein n=1 Tax=Loa loa TaxID=7209 RepID=A0A1S0TK18_LOALO|nr:hypothetical protein LOAG_13897 [Loa loa]EFO14620.1 hypothetical protein LOAG_13897 [Loa loa]